MPKRVYGLKVSNGLGLWDTWAIYMDKKKAQKEGERLVEYHNSTIKTFVIVPYEVVNDE
jgi:hypothetical protein